MILEFKLITAVGPNIGKKSLALNYQVETPFILNENWPFLLYMTDRIVPMSLQMRPDHKNLRYQQSDRIAMIAVSTYDVDYEPDIQIRDW